MNEHGDPQVVRLRSVGSHHAKSLAELHVLGLPESINSLRGKNVVAWLYQRIASDGHYVFVVQDGSEIVGALALIDSSLPFSLGRLAAYEPLQWLRLLVTQPLHLMRLAIDAGAVERPRKMSFEHFYIASLVVSSSHKRRGIAKSLVLQAVALSRARQRSLFVDTHRSNTAARSLYRGVGFEEVAKTRLSVVFRA